MSEKKNELNISTKSFITALLMLFVMMIGVYILTFLMPAGSYERASSDGQEMIVPGTYSQTEGGISFLKWILSPLLALGAEGGITIIAIIVFLLIIGGVFNALSYSKILQYMLDKISSKYQAKRYRLLCAVSLFFMALGAFVGSFEECVPMVPLAVALACAMGWDALTGLGMSILSIGCGFACGILNPFTVGVAQELAGLPVFSGLSMRLLSFVIVYLILIAFLLSHVRRLEKKEGRSVDNTVLPKISFTKNTQKEKALMAFVSILGLAFAVIIASSFIPALQDILMPLIALAFLLSGTASVLLSGVSLRDYGRSFGSGILGILPAVLLILMASSVKYTMTESGIMDSLLYYAIELIETIPSGLAIIFIYLLVLVLNLFIASGSAKAFLLIPLIMPMADLSGISRQLTILAFAYGDGFSNLFYPTNPVLLISLGLAGVSYGKWAKWSLKIQLALFIVTSGMLLLGNIVGY